MLYQFTQSPAPACLCGRPLSHPLPASYTLIRKACNGPAVANKLWLMEKTCAMKRTRPRHVARTKSGTVAGETKPPSSQLGRFWRRYKDESRYQSSPFPFPPSRMNLFDKLHGDFISLLSMVGVIWLAVALVRYLLT